jgi:targeting protein for Xklp2
MEREELELNAIQPIKPLPLNKKILKSVIGVPKVEPPILTIPQSPAIQKPKPFVAPPSPARIIKSKPAPKPDKPFEPVVKSRKLNVPEFSLPGDTVSKKKREKIKQNIQKEMRETAQSRKFRAAPAPKLPTPEKLVAPVIVTEPKPFSLETDLRGAISQAHLTEKLSKQEQERKEMKKFVAQPIPKTGPFVPNPSEKMLTEVQNLTLHTDSRAKGRHAFDEKVKHQQGKQKLEREQQEKLEQVN